MRMSWPYRLTIAYLIIVAFTVLGFIRLESLTSEVKRVSEFRAMESCIASVEGRQFIVDILEDTPPPIIPEDASPALRRFMEGSEERTRDLVVSAKSSIRDLPCYDAAVRRGITEDQEDG